MRTPKFSGSQIIAILKQNENSAAVQNFCREHGMSSTIFYKRRAEVGGTDVSLMKEIKELRSKIRGYKRNIGHQFFNDECLVIIL